jgi:hypothetical protein
MAITIDDLQLGPEPADEPTQHCVKHQFDVAEDHCTSCGESFCPGCLVYPFGLARPLCIPCALVAGGVHLRGAHGRKRRGGLRNALRHRG